ncbi:unnamed protein product [Prorocentrum cordatum]|uniref:Uncharacterized protein n=1 Tax=Prorocentrum cordatum TaxID=2364126 RepID=A0ABN9VWY1_9DINO|nr:unnamed protein product [Polarella glacialis]
MITLKVKSLYFVLLGTLVNGLVEYVIRVSLSRRDAAAYRGLFGRVVDDPCRQLADDRSKNIRAHTFAFETTCQQIFTVNGCLFLLLLDVSTNGRTRPSLGPLLSNAMVQIGVEKLVDFSILLTLKKVYGYDIMARVEGRSWKWSLLISPFMLLFSAMQMMDQPGLYCRAGAPSPHAATWEPCPSQ